jgi:hypothetical protein
MLHIKLHSKRPVKSAADPMGRSWVGYDPELSDEDLFDQNRGRWVLGKRAEIEQYAIFSYTGDHTVKFVAEITGFAQSGEKRFIEGHVLEADHPVAQRWVGAEAPDNFRNPTTYIDDERLCACGCGEATKAGRAFAPGHDQRAIHERITRQWGGTLGFIRWFDATFPCP